MAATNKLRVPFDSGANFYDYGIFHSFEDRLKEIFKPEANCNNDAICFTPYNTTPEEAAGVPDKAKVNDIAMEREWLMKNRHSVCLIDSADIPQHIITALENAPETGFVYTLINRKAVSEDDRIKIVDAERFYKINEFHLRLTFHKSVLESIKKGEPLKFVNDYLGNWGELGVTGCFEHVFPTIPCPVAIMNSNSLLKRLERDKEIIEGRITDLRRRTKTN
jgi:hypothetical protein